MFFRIMLFENVNTFIILFNFSPYFFQQILKMSFRLIKVHILPLKNEEIIF